MTKLLTAIFLFFSIPAFAQVQAPDYNNQSLWQMESCDMIIEYKETNIIWHDDYVPKGSDPEPAFVMVMYKPVRIDKIQEILGPNPGEAQELKAIEVATAEPWLLLYSDPKHQPGDSVFLFEYRDNGWKLDKTFKSGGELNKFLREKYGIEV